MPTDLLNYVPEPWDVSAPPKKKKESDALSLDEMRAESEEITEETANAALAEARAGSIGPDGIERGAMEKFNRVLGQISSPFYETLNDLAYYAGTGFEHLDSRASGRPFRPFDRNAPYMRPGEMGPAENAAEEVARGAGKGIEATAAFMVPALRASRVPAMLGTPSTIPAKEAIARTVADATVRNPALEMTAGATAGAAAELANQALPEDTPSVVRAPVQAAAGIAGGAAPVLASQAAGLTRYLPGRMAFEAVKSAVGRGKASEADAAAAGKTVRDAMTPEAQARLRDTRRMQERMRMRSPLTLAEGTESPQLLAVQRDIEDSASGTVLDALVTRRRTIEEDIRNFGAQQGPPRVDNDGVVIDVARARVESARNRGAAMEAALQSERQAAAAALPQTNRFDLGSGIRQQVTAARRAKSAELSKRAQELGLNENTTEFDVRPLQDALAGAFKRGSEFDVPPPDIVTRLRNFGKEDAQAADLSPLERSMREQVAADQPVPMTFQALKDARERVSDELIDAIAAANPDTRKIRDLVRAKSLIDEYVNSADPIGGGQVAGNWKQFRQEYYDQFVRRFEEGAAFRVRAHGARDEFKVVNERVADQFLKGPTQIKQYKDIFGGEGELTTAFLDQARAAVVKDGVVDLKRLESFLAQAQNKGVLSELPTATQTLTNVREATAAFAAREAQLAKRAALIERSELASLVGEANVPSIVKSALGDPTYMRRLFAELPKEAHPGLRRAIWEEAVATLGPLEIQNAVPFANFLKQKRPALEIALDKKHLSDLDMILEGVRKATLLDVPEGAPSYGSVLEKIERATGTGVPQASSRIFAVTSGRTSGRYAAIDWFSRLINRQSEQRTRALLGEALYNPDVARTLAGTFGQEKLPPPQARLIRSYLFTLGYPILENTEEDAN